MGRFVLVLLLALTGTLPAVITGGSNPEESALRANKENEIALKADTWVGQVLPVVVGELAASEVETVEGVVDLELPAGRYRIEHYVGESEQHFVKFIQVGGFSRVQMELECRLEGLPAPPRHTDVFVRRERQSLRLMRVLIEGEGFVHFLPVPPKTDERKTSGTP